MIKIPARDDGRWTVQFANDKLPDLVATRNLNFDIEGVLRLSHPTVSFFSDADDANFGVPIFFGETSTANIYRIWTDETSFHFSPTYDTISGSGSLGTIYGGRLTVTEDTTTNVPAVNQTYPYTADACVFNGEMHVSDESAVLSVDLGASMNTWTSRITGLSTNSPHPIIQNHKGNTLCVGDDNVVRQYNTSYAAGTALTLPSTHIVKCLAYNNGYIAVGTHDAENLGLGAVYVWDGNTTAANYYHPVGCSTVHTIVPYRGTFLILTGLGQVLMWTPQELVEVSNLPIYYNTVGLLGKGVNATSRNSSGDRQGGVSFFNISGNVWTNSAEKGQDYIRDMASGVWCFDPSVGFYHRHATTAVKVVVDVVATSDVDTTDNEITVTAAPDTGTPVRYYCADSATAIGGLDDDALYYTIKVDGTTIRLAASYQDALDGTEIDLTGTGNSNQVLQFYKKSDFGQSYSNSSLQGAVQIMESSLDIDGGTYIDGMLYGANVEQLDTSTSYKCAGYVMPDTENRGYFVTSRFQSAQLQDDWHNLYIKHNNLTTALDKIVVKYRTDTDRNPIVSIKYVDANRTVGGTITWSDSDTFTSTDTQFANVKAGDEVEIVQGAGAGYCIHITSISETGGTYTVNLDEEVKNISASDTARAIVNRWTYLTTLHNDTITNEDGYSQIAVNVKSKSIQFKVELRGEDVEIEEMLVAHSLYKPVA